MCTATQPAPGLQEILPQVLQAEDVTGDRNGKVSLELGKWVNTVCHGTESAKVRWEEMGM